LRHAKGADPCLQCPSSRPHLFPCITPCTADALLPGASSAAERPPSWWARRRGSLSTWVGVRRDRRAQPGPLWRHNVECSSGCLWSREVLELGRRLWSSAGAGWSSAGAEAEQQRRRRQWRGSQLLPPNTLKSTSRPCDSQSPKPTLHAPMVNWPWMNRGEPTHCFSGRGSSVGHTTLTRLRKGTLPSAVIPHTSASLTFLEAQESYKEKSWRSNPKTCHQFPLSSERGRSEGHHWRCLQFRC